jgi:hypothetical protein
MNKQSNGEHPAPWQKLLLSDDINRDILALYSDEKINKIARLMGDRARKWAIKRGLLYTVKNYLAARFVISEKAPGKAEWNRFVRFQQAATTYANALKGLMENGAAYQRMALDLAMLPENLEGSGDRQFKKMFKSEGPASPLKRLQELTEATARSSQRLIELGMSDSPTGSQSAYLENLARTVGPDDPRRVDYFCTLEAAKAFCRVWRLCSDKPFNGGKYYSEVPGFVGDAIQATHQVIATIDHKITQRRVAEAMREINAETKGPRKSGGKA